MIGGNVLMSGANVARKASEPAKKASGSENRRHGTLVRLAEDVVAEAKVVAQLRGLSMAEYLSNMIRPQVKKDVVEELKKRTGP